MSVNKKIICSSFLLLLFCSAASAQTSVFTYQGKLTDTSAAANGQYDFTFKLFDAPTGGNQIGADAVRDDAVVTGGIFTVNLDFGAASFTNSAARFLEISVRTGASSGAFTILAPRQQITSAPFSIQTLKADAADALSNSCVLCVTDAQIQTVGGNKVSGTVASANTANSVSGIVPVANGGTGSATKNFVDLSSNQTNIGGDKTFDGVVAAEQFVGDGGSITGVYGTSLIDGTVTKPKLAYGASSNYDLPLVATLRWDLLAPKSFPVGNTPIAAAFDGANIWVTNSLGGNVTKLRAVDGVLLGTFPVPGAPDSIAFDGANVWISNSGNNLNTVTKLRVGDGANLGNFPVGTSPKGVAFDGENIWVANSGSNNVTKLRASDGVVLGTFAVGSTPVAIVFDGGSIWVANGSSGNVTKLRASDGANLATVLLSVPLIGMAFDGTFIWVRSNAGFRVIRVSDNAPLGNQAAPGDNRGIAYDGLNLWISSNNTVIKTSTFGSALPLGFFAVPNAAGVVFDGSHIWVVSSVANGSIVKIPVR